MKKNEVRFMTHAAVIAAVYVVLCLIFEPISYGVIQTRIAEALTVLPYLTPAAVPGLFVGCLLANLLGGGILPDMVVGSAATLLGALGTYLLRKRSRFLAPLPPLAANTLLVPFVLKYGYGEPFSIPFLMGTVGIGELLTCGIMGTVLLTVLVRYRRIFAE